MTMIIEYDNEFNTVSVDGNAFVLTPLSYKLFKILHGQEVSALKAAKQIWGTGTDEELLQNFANTMFQLRKKLGKYRWMINKERQVVYSIKKYKGAK